MDRYDSEVRAFIAQRPEVQELIRTGDKDGIIAYLKANPADTKIFLRIFAQ